MSFLELSETLIWLPLVCLDYILLCVWLVFGSFHKKKMASKCRQNYHENCEALVNHHINIELNTYNKYLAMVSIY